MVCKLYSLSGAFVPGGYPYEQSVNGKIYKWQDIGLDIVSQARKIAGFRKANGIERSSVDECVDDVSAFTCQRLGCDPRFCSDGSTPTQTFQQAKSGGCASCGAKI